MINEKQKLKLKEIIRNIQYACGEMHFIKSDISFEVFTQTNNMDGFDKEIIATFNSHIDSLHDAIVYMDSF